MGLMEFITGATLAGLSPGATVVLPPGDHEFISITRGSFNPPVVIDARQARVKGVRLHDVDGVIWRGGTITAPDGKVGRGPPVYGVDAKRVKNVRFEGITFTDAARGIVFNDSDNIVLKNNHFTGLRTDGINMAGVTGVLIEGNRFDNFTPIKPTGDKKLGNWKDGDHPDAVQIWTSPTRPYGADITIRGNIVEGDTQGLTFFGPPGEGYKRVVMEGNTVTVGYPSGMQITTCTDCRVTGNDIRSVPGARWKANLRLEKSEPGLFCGNKVRDIPSHPGNAPCPKGTQK